VGVPEQTPSLRNRVAELQNDYENDYLRTEMIAQKIKGNLSAIGNMYPFEIGFYRCSAGCRMENKSIPKSF